MEHIKYKTLIKKPILFKYMNYHYKTWQNLKKNKTQWIQSTGTASLKSHIIQVQFIHHTWLKIAENLPIDKTKEISILKNIYHSFLNKYKLRLEKTTYTQNKQYIAISHSIKKELIEHFNISPENIEIIHHGVDANYFHPVQDDQNSINIRDEIRGQLKIKKTDHVLLHVGALNSRKGLYKTVEVLSYLKKNGFDNLKFLAVGSGDLKILDGLKKEYNLEKEIILAPHSKDIRNYYWASDLFFFPTFYEPFGLVVLEAMACGLPVVTSSLAGASELIQNNENGILFNPNDSASNIADLLLPLLRDKNYHDHLAKMGRLTALEQTWEKVGQAYQKFYRILRSK